MNESTTFCPPATTRYQLGAAIELHDLLALPPDGNRYTRDAEGRLTLMSPDDWARHGFPIIAMTRFLVRALAPPFHVLHERAVAFERVLDLKGRLLPPSFLGPKAIEPDHAVFDRVPDFVTGPHGLTFVRPSGLRLVVEVLSPETWRSDLGIGQAEDVDRRRTYLEAGIPEFWIVNPAIDAPGCPVAPRTVAAWARTDDGRDWEPLPAAAGVLRSRSIEGLALDLEAFWSDCGLGG